MKFGNPEYFLLWLLLPVLIGFIWAYQRKTAALETFCITNSYRKLTPSAGLSVRYQSGPYSAFSFSLWYLL